MSDTWSDIQALKDRQNTLRAKMLQRKREREGLVAELQGVQTTSSSSGAASSAAHTESSASLADATAASSSSAVTPTPTSKPADGGTSTTASSSAAKSPTADPLQIDPEVEKKLLLVLCDISLDIPSDASIIADHTSRALGRKVELAVIEVLLKKLAAKSLISIIPKEVDGRTQITVISLDISQLEAMSGEKKQQSSNKRSRDSGDLGDCEPPAKSSKGVTDIEEKYLVEKFKTPGGAQLKEFCPYGVKEECRKVSQGVPCNKLHFKKIIQKHTDESLGDCSFLNTCFHMDTCKYVHYEIEDGGPANVDMALLKKEATLARKASEATHGDTSIHMFPPQYIQCDLRFFDMTTLGKCAVVMADPPWDIHMELPYGTMGDDEMRRLDIPSLQDEGFIFLWVTGRAMELGRECLELWGYKRCDEIIWVKTNQLQRIIRTGRTGHWLNHGKEHCLVGVKGNPKGVNRALDCDVIVAEVRATSHKPDEIYGIIERLSPGTRKVELFGRPHNVQPNWITLGNQLEGVCLKDPDVVRLFREKYPDGNCMEPPKNR